MTENVQLTDRQGLMAEFIGLLAEFLLEYDLFQAFCVKAP